MKRTMRSVKETEQEIARGKTLLIAGDEKALRKLPAGKWIGGTSAYFMCETGGACTRDQLCVTEMPEYIVASEIQTYDENALSGIYADMTGNEICFILIPGMSNTLLSFALNNPNYEGFGTYPMIGWVSGVHLDDLEKSSPKVMNGETGKIFEDAAVVMRVKLPEHKAAEVGILNIFHQGGGDAITFPSDGFSAADAYVNGKKVNFADYLIENRIDTKPPLVASYCGVMVNVSFQAIDEENKIVYFYAPVFKNIEYRLARHVTDYISEFSSRIPAIGENEIIFSCNCILNYLYSELEGKRTEKFTGPITFGEIAYQLLNQTITYLTIHDV